MILETSDVVGPSMAAQMLGISKRHVLRLADAGKLEAIMTPLGRLVTKASVERLREERHEAARV